MECKGMYPKVCLNKGNFDPATLYRKWRWNIYNWQAEKYSGRWWGGCGKWWANLKRDREAASKRGLTVWGSITNCLVLWKSEILVTPKNNFFKKIKFSKKKDSKE